MATTTRDNCPCGSKLPYLACCGCYVDTGASPPTAEALMRSRYTAYVLRHETYLLATWHPATRPATLGLAGEIAPQWFGLDIKHHTALDATHATVEFVARYKINGRAHRLHEISRFVREDNRWYYIDGQ